MSAGHLQVGDVTGREGAAGPGVSDTHPEVDRVQAELLRRATPAQRMALTRSLSRSVIELSRRALARANPGMSQSELDLLFVQLHYGVELASRLRLYLTERSR